MNKGKAKASLSFIKGFRRRRRAVRIAIGLLFLVFLNLCCGQFLYRTVGNTLISAKVKVDNFASRLSRAYTYSLSVFHDALNDDLFKLKEENFQLKLQLNQLKKINEENLRLQQVVQLKEKYLGDIIIAKVSTIFVTDFARSAIINVGIKQGVSIDDVIINNDGLVGRVIDAHKNWSKILLVTDSNFSVPAKVGEQNVNIIVGGDNAEMLKVNLIHEDIPLNNGDKVSTSEYSDIFDADISIGDIIKNDQDILIKPCVDFKSLKYVGAIKRHAKHQ